MGDWVVGEGLDRVIVTVLEDTLQLTCPDDDALVCSPTGEPLAVPGVVDAVHGVLVSLERLDEGAIRCVIHQHPLTRRNNNLSSIRPEGKVIILKPE